jgi:bifunctional non-homologous end joining protein LigD
MLARPDRLPRGDWSYEVKWDGFRAIVTTENGLEVRSRRGWSMADRLPELAGLPAGLVLDGELVAFGLDGRPSFPLLGQRVLHGREAIPVTLIVFDVLRIEGADAMCLPYVERRALLEALELSIRSKPARSSRRTARPGAAEGYGGSPSARRAADIIRTSP